MSRSFLLTALVTACSSYHAYPPPKLALGQRYLDFDLHAKRVVLPNGMVVVLLPDDSTTLVNVDLRYLVGANGDPEGKAGLAHLVEHLAFELRPDGADKPSFGDQLRAHGLYYNAFTNWSVTHYTTTTTPEQMAEVLRIEAARMHPTCSWLTDDVVAREREVVLNEVRMRQGPAAAPISILLKDIFPGDATYGRMVGGSLDEVSKLTRADVCAFMFRQYTPKRAVLFVSGAIDPVATPALIASLFVAPGPAAPSVPEPSAPALNGETSRHKLPVIDAGVEVAFAAPAFGSPDRPAAAVLELALDQAVSRLYEKKFITAAGVYRLEAQSLWVFSLWVDDAKHQEDAVEALFKELHKTESELHAASKLMTNVMDLRSIVYRATRSFALSEALRRLESPTGRATQIAEYATAKVPGLLPKEMQALARMDSDAVAALAERELVREKSHIVFIDPDPEQHERVRRADVVFKPDEHDIPEWKSSVAPGAAQKPEPITKRRTKALVLEGQLDNGLRVLLAPSLGFPTVDARLVFRSGSGDSPADQPCLGALAAQTLQGTFTGQSLVKLQAVFRMAGQQSVVAANNATTFDMHGPAPNQDALLWQLGWWVVGGDYNTNTVTFRDPIKKTHAAVLGERRWRTMQEVFGGGRVCADLQQADRDVGAAPRDDFRRDHLEPSRAAIVLTGAWDQSTMERVRDGFSDWASIKAAPPAKTAPVVAGTRVFLHNDLVAQGHLTLGFVLGGGSEERAARAVLVQLLRQRMQRLRTQLASTYTTGAILSREFGQETLFVDGDFNPARADEMFKGVVAELDHITGGEGFDEDFVRARRAALHSALSANGDTTRLSAALSRLAADALPISALDTDAEDIAKLTPDALRQVIARDLHLATAAVLVEAPKTMPGETLKLFGGAAPRVVD